MITQGMFSVFARRVAGPDVPSRATASGGEESQVLLNNKAIVRRLYEEVWNKRRLEVADELISPSHALNDPIASGSEIGPELYKRRVVEFTTSFSDLRFTIEDIISEKAKVVVSWIISGTLPATGSKIFLEGITIHHITNGKILDSHARWDVLGLLRQLGDVSPLRPTAASVS
jgi:predicted ester cyclase